MRQRGKTLMNELLALPAQERQTIAEALLTSLTTDEYEDALEAELDRCCFQSRFECRRRDLNPHTLASNGF